VSVDRPCFVRLETVINGSAGSDGEGYAGVGRYFTAAGTARMSSTPARVGYVRGGHTRVTIVAYASAADGASTVAAIRVRGVNTLISAPLRVIHAR